MSMSCVRLNYRFLFVVACVVCMTHALTLAGDFSSESRHFIPKDVTILLEVEQPKNLLAPLLEESYLKLLAEQKLVGQAIKENGFQELLAVKSFLEMSHGSDWKTLVQQLVGKKVLIAATFTGKVWMIVEADDAAVINKTATQLIGLMKMDTKTPRPQGWGSTFDCEGVKCYDLADSGALALIENRLVFSNDKETLKTSLAMGKNPAGASIADSDLFQSAYKQKPENSVAFLFVDARGMNRSEQWTKWKEENANPMSVLLLAPLYETIENGTGIVFASLQASGKTYRLLLSSAVAPNKTPDAEFDFSTHKPSAGAMPPVILERHILGLSFYRNLYEFYKTKDSLFPERSSGLIFFENMMGIFFSGRDLMEEVFAELEPNIQIYVASQEYDAKNGVPQVQLPAFAAVFRAKDEENFREVIEEAWQKAVGLVAITSGQKGSTGLIIDRNIYKGVKYYCSAFGTSRLEDKKVLPLQFNFRPSLALVNGFVIIASTDQITENLIDALLEQAKKPAAAEYNTHGYVETKPLRALLEVNQDTMIQNAMVEKGLTIEGATAEVQQQLLLLSMVQSLRLSVGKKEQLLEWSLEAVLP